MKNKMELQELKKEVKVISADTGLAEGTIVTYDPEKNRYISNEEHTEVGDGYEYTTTASTSFSPDFVNDNMGVLFVSEETEVAPDEEIKNIELHFINAMKETLVQNLELVWKMEKLFDIFEKKSSK